MNKKLNIDYLLVFLILSIISLYTFVGDLSYFIPNKKQSNFKTIIDLNQVIKCPNKIRINKTDVIEILNPSYKVFYSTNGGSTYHLYEGEPINEITTKNIKNISTSITYKKPFGFMPKVISLLIKAENNETNFYTKPKPFVFIVNYNSNLPFFSLIINEKDLFDKKTGIMVTGEHAWQNEGFYKEIWYKNANYNQRGDKWRKKTWVNLVLNDTVLLSDTYGIQISGHASRSFSQKSLKLKVDKRYGKSKLKNQILKDSKVKKYTSLVLRNSGNDNKKTMFADLLMHNLIKNLNVISQSGKTVNVFINGNYWGLYNLRERQNSYYVAKKEKVSKKEVTIIQKHNGVLKTGDSLVALNYVNLIDSLYNLKHIDDKCLQIIKSKISLKSFIDYIIIETFYGNNDWFHNNTLWYKAGNKKWKWIIVDLDVALAYNKNNLNTNYFTKLFKRRDLTSKLFQICFKNKKVKNEFKNRAKYIITNTFTNQRIDFEYKIIKSNLNKDINWQINRWRENFSKKEWEQNCLNNYNFLKQRRKIFLKQIENL